MASSSAAVGTPQVQGAEDIEQTAAKAGEKDYKFEDEWDSTRYDITGITSWGAFVMTKGCAWDNATLWRCMTCNLLVSVAVAGATHFLPPAWLVSAEKFEKL